jgi:1-acyl-sn-glycerol-3-phosphate acyltransferase
MESHVAQPKGWRGRLAAWILRLFGWKVINHNASLPDKYILIVIPHTSNWDFPIGVLARAALEEDMVFIGKASLFKGPLGPIMRGLNGYPVDRSQRSNFVEAVADIYNSKPSFKVCISPEGTRKKVKELKTGFYYIALEARIPIVLCRFDYARREVDISVPFYPSGNKDEDFAFIHNHFKGIRGFWPKYSFGID